MLCDLCFVSEATLCIQELVTGQAKAVYLCNQCAEGKMLSTDCGDGIVIQSSTPSSSHANQSDSGVGVGRTKRCLSCGRTSDEVMRTGRMGCAGCYDEFSEFLQELLPQIHRGTRHCGKRTVCGDEPTDAQREPVLLLSGNPTAIEHIVRETDAAQSSDLTGDQNCDVDLFGNVQTNLPRPRRKRP